MYDVVPLILSYGAKRAFVNLVYNGLFQFELIMMPFKAQSKSVVDTTTRTTRHDMKQFLQAILVLLALVVQSLLSAPIVSFSFPKCICTFSFQRFLRITSKNISQVSSRAFQEPRF